ncbi:hypothetical protein PFISCL1PPCAC_12999, partial [Pristionchus fissidentatus]
QIMIPIIIQMSPIGIYAYSIITVSFTPDFINVIFCFQMTHALVHTIILITTTPSYRKPFLCWKHAARHESSVATSRGSPPQLRIARVVPKQISRVQMLRR